LGPNKNYGSITALDFSEDSQYLLAGCEQGTLLIYKISDKEKDLYKYTTSVHTERIIQI
jgi:hypothetical protein